MSKKSVIAVIMTLVLVAMQSIAVSTHAQPSEEGNCEYTFNLNEMNTCAVNAYISANKQLNQVLENVNSRLTSEHKIQLLEKAQRAWREFRKSYCDFAGYPVFDEPGYLFHKHDCLERITKQHLKNLEQYAAGGGILTGTSYRVEERLEESDSEVAIEEPAEERLDAVYQDVMNQLYSPVEKRWLEKAHISWRSFRQDYCDLAVDQNGCLERITRQQIENLERYIEDLDV